MPERPPPRPEVSEQGGGPRAFFLLLPVALASLLLAAHFLRFFLLPLVLASLLVGERQLRGEPWLRLGIILAVVALLTLGAALVLELPALRRRLRRPEPGKPSPGPRRS